MQLSVRGVSSFRSCCCGNCAGSIPNEKGPLGDLLRFTLLQNKQTVNLLRRMNISGVTILNNSCILWVETPGTPVVDVSLTSSLLLLGQGVWHSYRFITDVFGLPSPHAHSTESVIICVFLPRVLIDSSTRITQKYWATCKSWDAYLIWVGGLPSVNAAQCSCRTGCREKVAHHMKTSSSEFRLCFKLVQYRTNSVRATFTPTREKIDGNVFRHVERSRCRRWPHRLRSTADHGSASDSEETEPS